MDLSKLIATGLSSMQAKAYALLIESGQTSPPQAAQALETSRTNAYKLLDKLVELGLAVKSEEGKKLSYAANNPTALTSVTARFRAEAAARDEAASVIMQDLLGHYYKHANKLTTEVVTGQKEVARLFRKQISLREDVYFIHTTADVPMMGFDTMHDIRIAPGRHGKERRAIMAAPKEPVDYAPHKRSHLEITWADKDAYTAPVEWSVTDSSLLIVSYSRDPQAILVVDPIIAAAFKQLWILLSSLLQQQETHRLKVQQAQKTDH